MKYFLIAGEASGDLHGKNLMKQLLVVDPDSKFQFWGGDQMSSIGGTPLKHIDSLAFMGFVEVIANLNTILKNIKLCKTQIQKYKPDALILIDYPGFNLRIAEFAKQLGIPVHYYISPQIWAWKQNRVHKIKKVVDEMYTILPFEKAFYKKFDYDVHYVGHPLVDAIQTFKTEALSKDDFIKKHELEDQPILALLPGSRVQEIKTKLPIMLKAAMQFENYQIIIAGAPNKPTSFYEKYLNNSQVKVIENSTYNLLNHTSLAMVTSGTATLETALFKVPQVVCYKASYLSYHIAKRLVKVPYISLVNLIMNQEVVKELIQGDLTSKNIVAELKRLALSRDELIKNYTKLEKLLGGGGASQKVAEIIYGKLKTSVN